jgi:hypothetical protein
VSPRPPLQRLAFITAQLDLDGWSATTRHARLLLSRVLPGTTRPQRENSRLPNILRRIKHPGH